MARGGRRMDRKTIGLVLGIGAVGAFLYLYARKAAAATAAAAAGPAATPGLVQLPSTVQPGLPVTYQVSVPAPTASQVSQAATRWSQLTPAVAPDSGWVNFPSGSQAAASLLQWGMDSQGSYYVEWSGQVFLIGAQDSYGNWSATPVSLTG
jgi:hypothetical protein